MTDADVRSNWLIELATFSEADLLEQVRSLLAYKQECEDPLWKELTQRQIDCACAIAILRFPNISLDEVLHEQA